MNVCQRNMACFGHMECMFDKIKEFFRVLEAWCHCDFRKMDTLKQTNLDEPIPLKHRRPKLSL